MSDKSKANGQTPANHVHPEVYLKGPIEATGMTKRETIATSALQGLAYKSIAPTNDYEREQYLKHLPKLAVELADALLEALE